MVDEPLLEDGDGDWLTNLWGRLNLLVLLRCKGVLVATGLKLIGVCSLVCSFSDWATAPIMEESISFKSLMESMSSMTLLLNALKFESIDKLRNLEDLFIEDCCDDLS